MASSITEVQESRLTDDEKKTRALQHVAEVVANNAEGLTDFMELAQMLHETGMLGFVAAFFEQGEDILSIVMEQTKKPEYAGGVKNAIGLAQLLTTLDVSLLQRVAGAVNDASKRFEAGQGPQVTGVFSILGALRDPDVSAGLSFALGVLKSLGQTLRNPQ